MVDFLLITSQYLPGVGGAPVVYDALARRMGGRMTVLTGIVDPVTGEDYKELAEFDADLPYPIVRWPQLRPQKTESRGLWPRVKQFFAHSRFERLLQKQISAFAKPYRAVVLANLTSLGWLVPILKRQLGCPVLLYIHGEEVFQDVGSPRAERRRCKALAEADGIIAVSEATRRDAMKKYGIAADKITVITNGVDAVPASAPREATRKKYGISDDELLILSVGRLVRRKGFDHLLTAWPRVRRAVPGARLMVVGSGPMEAELHAAASAESSVVFVRPQSAADIASLYAAADLFAMPCRTLADGDREGFGLVFLEAAAAGLPVVAGRSGGAAEAVRDQETGLIVDGADIEAIAQAIIRLAQDAALRESMGRAGKAFARSQNWDSKAVAFLKYLESAVRKT